MDGASLPGGHQQHQATAATESVTVVTKQAVDIHIHIQVVTYYFGGGDLYCKWQVNDLTGSSEFIAIFL